jgi:hypothetical protein
MPAINEVRCTHHIYGYAIVVPHTLWDDFQEFLARSKFEPGASSKTVRLDGFTGYQAFSGYTEREIDKIRDGYVRDFQARSQAATVGAGKCPQSASTM